MVSESIIKELCATSGASVDWSQFWPSIIATFAGFLLALFGQWLWERYKDEKESKALQKRLKVELEIAENVLSQYHKGIIDLRLIKTPVWDEAIHAGKISLLKMEIRSKLFVVYNAIDEFNSWCAAKTKYYITNGTHNEKLCDELEKQKGRLLGQEKLLCDLTYDNFISIHTMIGILSGVRK